MVKKHLMSDQKTGYYYEHVNGTVHWKPRVVVESAGGPDVYFNSPMVKRWWLEERSND